MVCLSQLVWSLGVEGRKAGCTARAVPHGIDHAVRARSSGQRPPPATSQRLPLGPKEIAALPSRSETPETILDRSISTAAMDFSGGGGATLSEMYQSARRLLLSARDGVARVERLASAPASSSYSASAPLVGAPDPAGAEAVRREVAQIQGLCAQMDRLWRSIPAKGQRDLWKRKVEQLSEEVESLKETLDKHSLRQRKRILEAKERAELFERANGESSHVLQIFDDEAQAMQSARSSSRMLDEAFETGVAILHKYSDQRDRLKSAQRKALDVLNTVGLSNSVLKLIEKRHRVDKRIAYGGMIITVVLMVAFWRWTH